MINPNKFMKMNYPASRSIQNLAPNPNKTIELSQIAGYERTGWDQPINVPLILYQKFKVNPPKQISASNQVSNNYPPSLIDFIRKAYLRYKQPGQHKIMQKQLRDIIEKNSNNLNAINWQNYPIPNIIPQTTFVKKNSLQQKMYTRTNGFTSTPVTGTPNKFQKQTISLPNLYNQSLIDKIQKPNTEKQSRIKSILQQKLQMIQQKYGQQRKVAQTPTQPTQQPIQQTQLTQPTKTFIGFKDQKQVLLEQQRLKYQQMAEKIKQQQAAISMAKANQQKSSVSQIIPNTPKSSMLQVIQSKLPQKVYEVKKIPQSITKQPVAKKQIKTTKITKKQLQSIVKASESKQQLRAVAKRFAQFNKIKASKAVQIQVQNEVVEDIDYKIVGKCKTIDKPYLRITHRPDPQTVRPQPILRKAFNHYKSQYKKGVSYDLIISQFRSIRQDLTVQDIRNSFTVEVYQQNMKMSLFEDDIIQFKQSQTNLWELYRQGLYNKRSDRTKFISYHFICMILQERYKQLQYMLTLIAPDVLQDKEIQQILKLKHYLVIGNYRAFFDFYSAQDQTCQKLMNQYIDKIRVKCLVMICKTFGEKITFPQIAQNIGEDQDILQVLAREEGAVIVDNYMMLKDSYQPLKKSQYLQIKKVTSLLD